MIFDGFWGVGVHLTPQAIEDLYELGDERYGTKWSLPRNAGKWMLLHYLSHDSEKLFIRFVNEWDLKTMGMYKAGLWMNGPFGDWHYISLLSGSGRDVEEVEQQGMYETSTWWRYLYDFPEYQMTADAQVRKVSNGRMVATDHNSGHGLYDTFSCMIDGQRYRRSLVRLRNETWPEMEPW